MSELRITGGELKGRRVKVPRGVRPSSAKLREALFSILADRVQGAAVLDLFAGAGGLGLEALSRGAEDVVFVERGNAQIEILKRNVAGLELADRVRTVKGDWRGVAARLSRQGMRFDIVLADPPYVFWKRGREGTKLLRLFTDFDIFSENGVLVVERPVRAQLLDEPQGLERILERAYGDSVLSLYRKGEDG